VVGKKLVVLFGSRFVCISRARCAAWGKVTLFCKYAS